MLLVFCMILAVISFLIECRSLKKQKHKRDIVASGGFLLIGVILCVLHVCHLKVPSPMSIIEYVFRPVSNYVAGILS